MNQPLSQGGRKSPPTALLGSAKIDIRHLQLNVKALGADRGKLGKHEKTIQRLVDIFLQDQCRREDAGNRVPVLVNKSDLSEILRLNHVELSDLRGVPLPHLEIVPPDVSLLCLNGYHRLYAGQRYLGPADQWWGVNIYSREEITPALLGKLIESDNNDDGTIFYRLRTSQLLKDKKGVKKWKAEFSPSKLRDYEQLQRQTKLKHLRFAFDKLLVFPGVWPFFPFGTSHRTLTLRCPEELTTYLQTLRSCLQVTEQKWLDAIDHETIATLEGRSPFYSLEDAAFVREAFQRGDLFINLPPEARQDALSQVLKYPRVMLSLHSFVEDTKWLEAPCKIVGALLPLTFKGTIRQGFFKYFRHPLHGSTGKLLGEEDFIVHASKGKAFSDAYRRVWLFAFRNFAYMGDIQPRQTARHRKIDKKNRAECWYRFAELAQSVGFSTSVIKEILEANTSDSAVAADALTCAKPSAFYHVPSEFVQDNSPHFIDILRPVEARAAPLGAPELTSDIFQKWRSNMRCGRPFDQAFTLIGRYGYLKNIYGQAAPIPRQTITHFAVFRDTFHAFFGSSPGVLQPLEDDEDEGDSDSELGSTANEISIFDFPEMTQPPTFDAEALARREKRKQQEKFDNKRRQQELDKAAEDKRRQQELDKAAEDKRRQQELDKAAEDKRRQQELDKAAEDKRRQQELDKAANDKRRQQELDKAAEDKRRQQELDTAAEDKRRQQELDKAAEEKWRQRELDKAAEDKRRQQELDKTAEDKRRQQELDKAANDKRRQQELDKAAEDKRRQQELDKAADDKRRQQELDKAAEDKRRQQELDKAANDKWRQQELLKAADDKRIQQDLEKEANKRRRREQFMAERQKQNHDQRTESKNVLGKRLNYDPEEFRNRRRLAPPKYRLLAGSKDPLFDAEIQVQLVGASLAAILQNYHFYGLPQPVKCVIKLDSLDDVPMLYFFAGGQEGKTAHDRRIRELRRETQYSLFDTKYFENHTTFYISHEITVPWNVQLVVAKSGNGDNFIMHPANHNYNETFWPRWQYHSGFRFPGIHQSFTDGQLPSSDPMDADQDTEEHFYEAEMEIVEQSESFAKTRPHLDSSDEEL